MASDIVYYSLEDVKLNNGKAGAKTWIIYKNSVYDVTEYMEGHPGGGELIDEWAGKDCTKAFDDAGHSSDAMKDMKAMKIGEIRLEDRVQKGTKKSTPAPVVKTVEDNPTPPKSCAYRLTCGLCG